MYAVYESRTLKIAENIKAAFLSQSPPGGTITQEKILKRVPKGCDAVYIKPEEDKAHQVNVDESGAVDMW